METDIKEEPWFSGGFPSFGQCGWQKTPFFWNNNQKITSQPGPFRPTAQAFTANEAMFGYTQPGFVSTRPSVVGHGVNNFFNNFVTARPGNWFDPKNSTFNIGDSQTKFGTNIQFKPRIASEIPNNRLVRYQTISIMPEYSDKSLEELRLEDYVANRQHVQQVPSNNFISTQNELPFFDALLRNRSNTFPNQFYPPEDVNTCSNVSDTVTNKYNEPSLLTNTNFLLEYLLNHVKHRLNVHLISDKTRYTCEKLTTKLAEYTEKTLESLTVVILEDILSNIKGKSHTTAPAGWSFPGSSKAGENESEVTGLAASRKAKTKSSRPKKAENRTVVGASSSNGCSRTAQPSKNETKFATDEEEDEEDDDVCSDASFAADDWCCATKRQTAPKKQRDRPQCAECRCEVRKKTSPDRAAGSSRTSGLRGAKSTYVDCCAKEAPVARRSCSSKCAKGKRTPSKGANRRCQTSRRLSHRCYDDEFYLRQRLKNVTVDTDDGEEAAAGLAPHKEKSAARRKAPLGDDFHVAGGAAIGNAAEDEGKDTGPPVTTDARSAEGTEESDFSSV